MTQSSVVHRDALVLRLRKHLVSSVRQKSFRFLIAGVINTVVGLAAYPVLLWITPYFRVHYLVALSIAQVSCLIFAFIVYKIGVFRTRGSIAAEFLKFSSFYAMNYAANWIFLPVSVEVFNLPPVLAQLSFTALIIVGSYFWHSRITFRSGQAGRMGDTP